MSIEDKNIIDIVSIDDEDNAVLTITDHLEWDTENEHLLILQDKINSYLGAIEGGELYTKYPNAENRNIIIRVIGLHSPTEEGQVFLERVKEVLETGGYSFQFKLHSIED
jgi:hypothetical protein